MNNECCQNTDRELWREYPGDFYANSVHVTKGGGIGMNVGGHVIVAPITAWFVAMQSVQPRPTIWARILEWGRGVWQH